MDLYSKSFWTYYKSTGRVPRVPDCMRIACRCTPLALKELSVPVFTPGREVLDVADITRKADAHALRQVRPVVDPAPLNGNRNYLRSDALSVPNSSIVPMHAGIIRALGGA